MSNPLPPLCIYHGNCTDGFAAAWAVRNAHPTAEFVAASYGSTPPDVAGRKVYIVDFSYPRDVLLAMAEKATQIVILDHHKTAVEQLVDLPSNVTATFDMERSGCMLAWQHFFGHELPPQLLLHIQDRDLWTWKLPHTKEILAAVFSYPHDFAVWDRLMWSPVDTLREEGLALQRKHDKDIESLLPSARRMEIAGHQVPAINLPPMMASDAGALLAKDQPFAAVYWDTRSGRQFSLRSAPDGIDVAAIAQQFGGGGHKHAAGFKVARDHHLATGLAQTMLTDAVLPKAWGEKAEGIANNIGESMSVGCDQAAVDRIGAYVDQLFALAATASAPLFDFAGHLQRQREWSERTFGPGSRAKGVVQHIRKELVEIEAAPGDLMEWIDVAILALDGAWRSGASPAQIIDALVAKQAKNEGRTWPDWRTMDPDVAIEHDRSGDAAMPSEAEQVATCLGDDAEVVRREMCHDSEIADNMERAAQLILGECAAPPAGWKVVPIEPTPEIIGAAAAAVWPVPSPEDIGLARKAALIVLRSMMDPAQGASLESVASAIATMVPAYRAMISAAPTLAGKDGAA